MKTARQIFGEQIAEFRQRAGLSVIELSRKSGTTRQSIYKIEAGVLNVTADQFEKLIAACGVSMEQWRDGLDDDALDAHIPRRFQGLVQLLKIIVASGDDDLIRSVRDLLDMSADKALRGKKRPNDQTSTGKRAT